MYLPESSGLGNLWMQGAGSLHDQWHMSVNKNYITYLLLSCRDDMELREENCNATSLHITTRSTPMSSAQHTHTHCTHARTQSQAAGHHEILVKRITGILQQLTEIMTLMTSSWMKMETMDAKS